MDGKKLASYVHLLDEHGTVHSFGPDTGEVPDWARAKITNPSAWVDADEVEPAAAPPAAPPAPEPEPEPVVEPEPEPVVEPEPEPVADPVADGELAADVEVLTKGNPDEVRSWLADASVRRITAALGAVDDEAARVDLAAALLALEQADGGRNRSSLVDELKGFTN